MELDSSNITAIIIAIFSLVGTAITIFAQRRQDKKIYKMQQASDLKRTEAEALKIEAEAENETVTTALSLVAPLRQRISELEDELKAVVAELKSIESLLFKKDRRIFELESREQSFMAQISSLNDRVRELETCVEALQEENRRLKNYSKS